MLLQLHHHPPQKLHLMQRSLLQCPMNHLSKVFNHLDVMRVKKLEQTVKIRQSRRRTRVVLSDEEEVFEDPSKQGRKIQEKISDDTKVLLEEEETTELIEEPTELVEDQGSGEKGNK
ncbi:hypothetical protein Tco_0188360, partial [Tanacetum coccineum]